MSTPARATNGKSATRRGVTEQAALAAIESGTRMLRLPTIRDRFPEIAASAERGQLSYLGFLAELVMAECDDRDKRRAGRRVHDAGFPRPSGSRTSTSPLTRPCPPRPCTSWPPAAGSAPANRSA